MSGQNYFSQQIIIFFFPQRHWWWWWWWWRVHDLILGWKVVHDLMMKTCLWFYDENLFMIVWWKVVHDLMIKTCSRSYDENLFMIIQCMMITFSPTCPKAKFRKIFSIYSNKFFHNFHLSKSSFTCPGLRASGLVRRLLYQKRTNKCVVFMFSCTMFIGTYIFLVLFNTERQIKDTW